MQFIKELEDDIRQRGCPTCPFIYFAQIEFMKQITSILLTFSDLIREIDTFKHCLNASAITATNLVLVVMLALSWIIRDILNNYSF